MSFVFSLRARQALVFAAALLAAGTSRGADAWVTGITEPINDVTMSAPVIGIIGARHHDEGAFVKKGQVMIELDKRIEEMEVNRRMLVRDQAKSELDRLKTLAERSTISVSREEMDKKMAEFKIASVEFDLAQEQLKRRQLISPFDGYVTDVFLEVGEGCDAQQPLLRVVDTSRCFFIVNIEARKGYSLKVGQVVKLEIEAGTRSEVFEGTINFVSPVVDPASGLLKIKVVFANPDLKIRPGVGGRMLIKELANVQ